MFRTSCHAAAAIACALALGSTALAQPFALDTAPFSSNPDVAALDDGRFLAAWTRDRLVPLSFGPDYFVPEALLFQRRQPSGAPTGGKRTALPPGNGAVLRPRVSGGEAGAQLAWVRVAVDAFTVEGRALRGAELGPVETIAGCAFGGIRNLSLISTRAGAWAIWNEACDGLRIVGQRLDRLGHRSGPPRLLAGPGTLPGAGQDFAPLPNGGFVGAWVRRLATEQGDERALVVRAFRADGRPLGAAFRVSAGPVEGGYPPFQPAVLAADNRILVAWPRTADGRLVMRAFRFDGTPLGHERLAGGDPDGVDSAPAFSNFDHGDAVLVWQRLVPGDDPECFVRRFDARGPVGQETTIAADCYAPSAALSNGRVMITWQEPQAISGEGSRPFRALGTTIALGDLR